MINVKDPKFGAIGDGAHDDFDAFGRALRWLRDNPPFNAKVGDPSGGLYQGVERLFIPAGLYYISKTLDIKGISLIMEGESCGGAGGHATVLHWKDPVTGIRIQRNNTGGNNGTGLDDGHQPGAGMGGDYTIIRNLSLRSDGGGFDPNTETSWSHGIHARGKVIVEDVSVQGFAHSGIFIHAAISGPANVVGNANCFALSRVLTRDNGVAGLWVQGNDSNAGTVTHLSATGNGQYGIFDASFLGNTYVGCHTEGNGTGSGKSKRYTQVAHNCNRYFVSFGQTSAAPKTEPDPKKATVWRLLSQGGIDKDHQLWVKDKKYLKGDTVSYKCNRYESVDDQAASTTEPDPTKSAVWKLTSRGDADDDHPQWGGVGAEYLDSGAYVSTNRTAENVFVGCYSEAGQPASYLESPALVLGGAHGADIYGDLPGIASILAPRSNGLEVTPGLFTEGEHTAGTITTSVGGNALNGEFLKFTHSTVAPGSWRLRIRGNDVSWDYDDTDTSLVYTITGPGTTLTFGDLRRTVPHAFYTPNLVIGGLSQKGAPDHDNARRVVYLPQNDPKTDDPPAALTSGNWLHGDFCFNSTPAVNGILGWSLVRKPDGTSKWAPLPIIDQVAAQTDSSAGDLATLKSEFNSLLAKMRAAGILAQ